MDNCLHIGGWEIKEGWKLLNIQGIPGADYVGDISDLRQFADGEFDKIYASHVLEHVVQHQVKSTLRGIHRILKPGGIFAVSVPDLDVLCKVILGPEFDFETKHVAMRMMFGGQMDRHDFHFFGWNYEFMHAYLSAVGFRQIERVEEFGLFEDTSGYRPWGFPISLNVIAQK